jgi:hypothetical protein
VDKLTDRVPLILTNPPFGEGQYDSPDGIARTAAVLPALKTRTRLDPSVACLARALTLLAPGGVLGIILPDGVLASTSVEELILGRRADHTGAVEVRLLAVVSLPPATFALSGTVARTSAVFLRRVHRQRASKARAGRPLLKVSAAQASGVTAEQRPGRRAVLARVDHVGFVSRAGRAAIDPEGNQLPNLAPMVLDVLAAEEEPESEAQQRLWADDEMPWDVLCDSPLVAVVDVPTHGTLDPSRLEPGAIAASRAILDTGGLRLGELITAVPARRCREVTTPYVSVLHVDDLGVIDWRAASANEPRTPGVLAAPGNLIVSLLNPAHLRAAVIPPGAPAQVSAEFGVFHSTVDPYAVLALLYSPKVRAQLRPLGTGTSSSRRRISAADVLRLTVPKLDQSKMDDLAATVRAAQQQLAAARDVLHRTYGG